MALPARLSHKISRFVGEIQDDSTPLQRIRVESGTVVHTGSTTDGATAIAVIIGLDTLPMPYYGATPAAGAEVDVLFVNGSPRCLPALQGFPAF